MYIIPHLYVVKHSWSFEFLNFQMYIFWIFKVLEFHTFEIMIFFKTCLIDYYHFICLYHQLTFIIWILWKSFVKIFFFNDRNFHFQKSLTKPKPKFGSNGFLVWFFKHSYVLKRNNVPWLPQFQMEENKLIFYFLW
jgi:hypothetical protein